ncbi:MAG: SAM-dependent chlorinase/fluorinase [Bdellovibrionaceae bacterium]|nr:SAM-dependent chlorinase/fluorinase [Pseudobdellovibrionaceae bacterium]
MQQNVALLFLVLTFIFSGCATGGRGQIASPASAARAVVLMTDFGLKDGAVSAMKGVAFQAAPSVVVSDLTHDVPPYDIWTGAYRLSQTYAFWPKGTVFVAVVDPGVGSERKSIALETASGHIFVGPDNGLFTLVADGAGISHVVAIDEAKQRIKGSDESYTFHGRDLYAYVGARLAGRAIDLTALGAPLGREIERIPYQRAERRGQVINGGIPVLDPNYGNVWTNIPKVLMKSSGLSPRYRIVIREKAREVFRGELPLVETFAAVPKGKPLLYFNSLMNLAVALNQGDFAKAHRVGSGPIWSIEIEPVGKSQ